ncbi:MAG: transglutaminase domain-containing protein [Oscillospiraceae bacterium]|nr:transglutaminase domain-containing protein [Oscillospiraceae bacterium]
MRDRSLTGGAKKTLAPRCAKRVRYITSFIAVLSLLFCLCGCAEGQGAVTPSSFPVSENLEESGAISAPEQAQSAPEQELPTTDEYIATVVADCLEQFYDPDMSEYEKTKAAFDFLIEKGTFAEPVAFDIWRLRSSGDRIPDYIENRSLSMLVFGQGACEDYASALFMLLTAMGLEAEYVPGLTYAVEGGLTDHAWNRVKIDGVWYHLDCELEAGIRKDHVVVYKYFLRGDATMSASHYWGQRLIDSGILSKEQNAEIAANYLGSACPQDYPRPEHKTIESLPAEDPSAIMERLQEERTAFEEQYGPLAPMRVNVLPPVFGVYSGYRINAVTYYREGRTPHSIFDALIIPLSDAETAS